ncbi:MAG: protein-L-isoaspartate(D-aspartate) O-methyltransferase [Deltaproteobacteria bacterium]|nr:protein-L-isoaspartate(D-aspartate) O-methyltransferase [Deltaproteobacteria bacterium]
MVERQLKPRGVSDQRVLEVMGGVPRHLFLDESLVSWAYDDGPQPIGHGQFISQPYIVASMTQALGLRPTDRVLEIGSGCGYQTAVLACLADRVMAVEIVPQLRDRSLEVLSRLGLENILLKLGDGRQGWPELAPFDAILVAAYSEALPRRLFSQLAPGGRMVIPLGPENGQRLVLVTKDPDGGQRRRVMEGCRFVPLVDPGQTDVNSPSFYLGGPGRR